MIRSPLPQRASMRLGPVRLEPVYVERAWGGLELLRKLHPDLPQSQIGESWDISSYPGADCIVRSGPFFGEPLSVLLRSHGVDILGRKWTGFNDFPLLLKFLAPLRDLALQVHPADEYARRFEYQNGKTECWFIMDCDDEAYVWLGLKNVRDKEHLARIIHAGEIAAHTRKIPVRRGDVVFVPAGMVHGLGKACLAFEIQQNSDVTYRLDDFGMGVDTPEDRVEHCRKGIDVIDLEANLMEPGVSANWDGVDGHLDFSPYFGLDHIVVDGRDKALPCDGFCRGLTVLSGHGEMRTREDVFPLTVGESWLLPCSLKGIVVRGALTVLSSRFPA